MQHFIRNRADRFHLDDIVDPHNVRPTKHASGNRTSGRKKRLPFTGLREERFTRRAHQNGQIQPRHFGKPRQNFGVLLPTLPETDAGVHHNPQHIHARAPGPANRCVQVFDNGPHHILQRTKRSPILRLPAHVVEDDSGVILHHRFHQ